jgi:epoxyqueuosine reductase
LAVPYQIDAKKCISYLTIELKDEIIPSEFKGKMEHWAFGCDICQDVCPWNRFSKPTKEQRFTPDFSILNLAEEDWRGLRKEAFQEMFKHSAIKRTKYEGWMRNVNFLSE